MSPWRSKMTPFEGKLYDELSKHIHNKRRELSDLLQSRAYIVHKVRCREAYRKRARKLFSTTSVESP